MANLKFSLTIAINNTGYKLGRLLGLTEAEIIKSRPSPMPLTTDGVDKVLLNISNWEIYEAESFS